MTPSPIGKNLFEDFAIGDLSVAVDESTRSFMTRVYLWMTLGIFTSGVVAFKTAANPAAMSFIGSCYIPLMIASVLTFFIFDAMVEETGGIGAGIMFLFYSVLQGFMLAAIFYEFQLGSIAQAFFITAAAFVALSLYATFTERDLSPLYGFILMGIVGLVVAGLVNLAARSPLLSFVSSAATVLVASALTAVTTQQLRTYHQEKTGESAAAISIKGALSLYLAFVNFFVSVVRLTARARD